MQHFLMQRVQDAIIPAFSISTYSSGRLTKSPFPSATFAATAEPSSPRFQQWFLMEFNGARYSVFLSPHLALSGFIALVRFWLLSKSDTTTSNNTLLLQLRVYHNASSTLSFFLFHFCEAAPT
jgi:hypothetical protein